MIIKPKNWIDFQHYKDRCPPWIKLHKGLLDNYEFQVLPDASKALAMCLWLVASEHLDGEIDADSTKLAFRFRQDAEKIKNSLKPLIDNGFFFVVQPASNTLAEGKQDAPLDRGETETETDAPQAASTPKPSRKKPQTTIPNGFAVSEAVKTWADAHGHSKLEERLSHFVMCCEAKGYVYADWDAAFRKAITDDWAKLGKATTQTQAKPTYRAKTQAEMDAEQEQHRAVMEERKRKILAMPVAPNPWEVAHV